MNIRAHLAALIRDTREQAQQETDLHERDRLDDRADLWQELYDKSADNADGRRRRRRP